MSTTVSYKGNTIATLNNETKTLTTAGTWVEGNISVADVPSGIDIPVFTVTFDSNMESVTSVTCNKTFAECATLNNNGETTILAKTYTGSTFYGDLPGSCTGGATNDNSYTELRYSCGNSPFGPIMDILFSSNGTITVVQPSAYALTLNATTNGTYNASNGTYTEVNVNVPGGNSPIFTLTFNNNHTAITSVTCNKTFAECVALVADRTALFKIYTGSTYEGDTWAYIVQSEVNNNEYTKIVYSSSSSPSGAFVDIIYESDGTITGTYPSAYALTLNATTNGTYNTNNHGTYTEVNVNVPTGTARTSSDLTVSGDTVTVPAGLYSSQATASVASGTAGTPTASKGTVNNHQVSVTPSVTNTTGYITGGTKTGTAVTVTASELASGNKEITSNGTNIDVVGYSTVSVDVPSSSTALISDTTDVAGGTIRTITTTDEVYLQTKTITPTSSQQTILPDTGYDGFSSVIVEASSGGSINIISGNLHDSSDDIPNTYIAGSIETSYNGWSSTDYIPVKPNTFYQVVNGPGNNYNAFYKSDKTSAKSTILVPTSSNSDSVVLIKTTSDTAYIRMSGSSSAVTNYEIYEVDIVGINIGGNHSRQAYYLKFYPSTELSSTNRLSLQLEPSESCCIFVHSTSYPTAPESGYKALFWGYLVYRYDSSHRVAQTPHAILRANGTEGTDSSQCSFNPSTGILLLGGQYGYFFPEDEYEVIQIVYE